MFNVFKPMSLFIRTLRALRFKSMLINATERLVNERILSIQIFFFFLIGTVGPAGPCVLIFMETFYQRKFLDRNNRTFFIVKCVRNRCRPSQQIRYLLFNRVYVHVVIVKRDQWHFFFCAREVHRKSREKNKCFTNVAMVRSLERFCKSLASAPRSTVHNLHNVLVLLSRPWTMGKLKSIPVSVRYTRVRNIFFAQADNGLARAIL